MIYIVTALRAEARPLVERFGLAETDGGPFAVYRGTDVSLAVSGIGKTAAAAAAAHLLTAGGAGEADTCADIGICGSAAPGDRVGDLKVVGRIVDAGSGKKHLLPGPGDRAAITCVDRPAGEEDREALAGGLVDMESAGFVAAARRFLPAHRIHVLKVVSDLLSKELPDEAHVSSLIAGALDRISAILAAGREP